MSFVWTDAFHSEGVPLYVTRMLQEENQPFTRNGTDARKMRCLLGHELGYADAYMVDGML